MFKVSHKIPLKKTKVYYIKNFEVDVYIYLI